jgi:group I intron endonuclease
MSVALVYVALCVPNGKLYFGITTGSLKRRVQRHVSDAKRRAQYKFHHALYKHRPTNFVWYEIGHVPSWKDACVIERALIRQFDTTHTGYNTTEGGEGSLGRHHTKESKRKLSVSVSRTMTPEHRARLAAFKLGNKATVGTRLKQSDAHLGLTKSREARSKMSASMTKYSTAFQAEAIAYAKEHGFRAASRKFGPPPITIRRWTWTPEHHEAERLKMLARAKARDASNRQRLLALIPLVPRAHEKDSDQNLIR